MNNIKLIKTAERAKIILSKPSLNILDVEDLVKLSELLDEIRNEPNIKAITIESDQKIFSAGVNVSDHSKENISRMLKTFHNVFFKMLDLQIPTISLVKSGCIGGGCELALFSDFILVSEKAYFSQPEIKIGCYPPASLVFFPYIMGNKIALEMILTGKKLSSDDALNYGIINNVFPEEKFDSEAEKFINSLVSNSSSIIKTTLKTYKKLHYSELKNKLEYSEKIYLNELMQLEDAKEGISSFLEKRSPVWTGR